MAKRKMYNTTLDADLIKEIRILAAQLEKRQNDLLEEAIQELHLLPEQNPHVLLLADFLASSNRGVAR